MLTNIFIKSILSLILAIIFISCSKVEVKKEIYDLKYIPQNVESYTNDINLSSKTKVDEKLYKEKYFRAWNKEPKFTLKNILWPFNSFKPTNSYGENLQHINQTFFDKMRLNGNFENYLKLKKKAITIRYTNLRVFPTDRPLFRNPEKAGEGFPFDYLQNSSILPNKPLLISHYSKDKNWVYAFSSFANGWLKVSDIVFLDSDIVTKWQNSELVYIIKEGIPLYTIDGDGLFNSKIGTSFLLLDENKYNYKVLVIKNNGFSKPIYLESYLSKTIAIKNILEFNKKNIDRIINEVSKVNYGWGGLYGQRDCSSTMRDYFTPFGIWLPRNSYVQSKVGTVIELKNLDEETKLEMIKREGVPFKTLLYRKGHIVLYVGMYKDDVIIFQNMWGIKTKKNGEYGRIVVGKPVFSTLKIGNKQDYFDEDSTLLKNLRSMNIVTQIM